MACGLCLCIRGTRSRPSTRITTCTSCGHTDGFTAPWCLGCWTTPLLVTAALFSGGSTCGLGSAPARYEWGLGFGSQRGPFCSCAGKSSDLWWEMEGSNPELLPAASKPPGRTLRAHQPLRHAFSSETWLLKGGGAQGEGQVLVIQERASAGKHDPGLDTQGWVELKTSTLLRRGLRSPWGAGLMSRVAGLSLPPTQTPAGHRLTRALPLPRGAAATAASPSLHSFQTRKEKSSPSLPTSPRDPRRLWPLLRGH